MATQKPVPIGCYNINTCRLEGSKDKKERTPTNLRDRIPRNEKYVLKIPLSLLCSCRSSLNSSESVNDGLSSGISTLMVRDKTGEYPVANDNPIACVGAGSKSC